MATLARPVQDMYMPAPPRSVYRQDYDPARPYNPEVDIVPERGRRYRSKAWTRSRTPGGRTVIPRSGSAPRGNPLNLSHRKVMQEQIEAFNQQHGRKLEKTREYIKDTCSLFAVVTIFLASLAAALLSYVNDTFSDRPPTDSSGSPIPTTKKTDDLIVLFLLLAIVTSVISTSFLIIGAIYAIFGPVKKRRPVLSTPIFALLSLVKVLVFPLVRFLRSGVHRDEASTVITDRQVDLLDYAAGRALRFMATALVFALVSVLTFFVALGIYIWADKVVYTSVIVSFVTFIVPPLFFFSVL